MLVLTRKYQEKIRIGDNITITVLRTKGKAVRLGIEAPPEVSVIRGELAFQQTETNPEAAATKPNTAPTSSSAKPLACQPPHELREPASAEWPAEPPQREAADKRNVSALPQVKLKRVPRNKVAEILPRFVARSRPLRSVMDRK